MGSFLPGERVYRLCWPTNTGTVRVRVSDAHLPGATNPDAHHLKVEWDDKPGELFEEWPRDLGSCALFVEKPIADPGNVELRVAAWSMAAAVPWPSLLRDRLTGRAWLTFPSKPTPEVIATLKTAGWRWSGYRKAWHHPRKGVGPPVPFQDDGECAYASERADRLEVRAKSAQAKSDAAYMRAKVLADGIPLGQPILVGHHSERRHRRDIARIQGGFEKALGEGQKARELGAKADASRVHQERMESTPVIQRRLDKLQAELRSIDARKAQWAPEHRADWQAKRGRIQAEVTRAELDLTAAGGPVVVDCKPGDLVRIKGHVVKVERVSAKSIRGTIAEGGAKGMTGKWDRSWYQGVVTPGGTS